MKDFPPLFLAEAINQDEARANPLSGLTSIGTWYVEPPIRLALTSNKGVAFCNAFWNAPKRSKALPKNKPKQNCFWFCEWSDYDDTCHGCFVLCLDIIWRYQNCV